MSGKRVCFNCGTAGAPKGESTLVSITPVMYRRGARGKQVKSGVVVVLCEHCLDVLRDQAGELLRREVAATLRAMKAAQ